MFRTTWLLAVAAIGCCFSQGEGKPPGRSGLREAPRTPSSVGRQLEGSSEDPGKTTCLTRDQCDGRRQEMGYKYIYVDDYSATNAYGCFSKGDNAFWGEGGTDEQLAIGELSGEKARIWCEPDGGPASGDGGGDDAAPLDESDEREPASLDEEGSNEDEGEGSWQEDKLDAQKAEGTVESGAAGGVRGAAFSLATAAAWALVL